MTKRRVALAFVGVLLALVAGSMAALRTRWVAERICALAAARVGAATGLEVATTSCRIDPFTLTVVTEGLRLGPAGAPLFTAEAIEARPALIQGLGGRLELAELRLTRPRLVVAVPPGPEAPRACPPPVLGQIDIGRLDLTDGSVELSLAGGGADPGRGQRADPVSGPARAQDRHGAGHHGQQQDEEGEGEAALLHEADCPAAEPDRQESDPGRLVRVTW